MKESVTYQAILEEGEAKGEAKGEIKGALAEARKFVLRLGGNRFGSPGRRITAVLEGIQEVEQLEELGERLLRAASWEELLDRPTPPRPRPRRRPKA